METTFGNWTRCNECIHFEDCDTKEGRDGCYFGEKEEKMINAPETINIEKYAEALNNLIGVDSAYYKGDKNVDAIVELIVAAKKFENRVKELTDENEKLKVDKQELIQVIGENAQRALEVTLEEIDKAKADTVRKMQEKISAKSEYGTINISPWQLDQIAKELLEEK